MSKGLWMMKNVISLPVVGILYCLMGLICVYGSKDYQDIMYGLVLTESFSQINLRALAGWTVILFFPLIVNGVIIDRCERINILCYVRTKSKFRYRRRIYEICLMNSALWSTILLIVHYTYSKMYSLELTIVLLTHIIMWTALMILCYVLLNRSPLSIILPPLICVLSIGISYSRKEISNYMISSLGMLTHSNLFEHIGISPLVQATSNIVISMICLIVASMKEIFDGGRRKWKQS